MLIDGGQSKAKIQINLKKEKGKRTRQPRNLP